jgi:hypothetical protein
MTLAALREVGLGCVGPVLDFECPPQATTASTSAIAEAAARPWT